MVLNLRIIVMEEQMTQMVEMMKTLTTTLKGKGPANIAATSNQLPPPAEVKGGYVLQATIDMTLNEHCVTQGSEKCPYSK